MKTAQMTIDWAGETLALLPERALFWGKERTLFIADPHFGKASTFRHAGIPVPESSHDDDLERLAQIIKLHEAERLIVLGDFFHAKTGRTLAALSALAAWREIHRSLQINLILGNHDFHAGRPPEDWDITCVDDPWNLAPFICRHKPQTIADGFVLAGHLHPAFRLRQPNSPTLTAVCFHFSERLAVLPAFGNFTGSAIIRPERGEKVFIISDGEVVDVSRII